jgi:hypothetical protein
MIGGRRDKMRGVTMTGETRVGMRGDTTDETRISMIVRRGRTGEVRGRAAMGKTRNVRELAGGMAMGRRMTGGERIGVMVTGRTCKGGKVIDGRAMGKTITGGARIGVMAMGGGTIGERPLLSGGRSSTLCTW